ncbi:cobalamin-binding protein [Shewanella khirikhana]|uniref:Vitamin B12-binding protein n=1 Tax=Shewanella khirikhana TaxID=1965282 RepID=A0ABN5TZL5_9GAMM|nr:cobalamin-binding protein [Shewanella khirikhana]AZQ11817.1 Vitamin B12-binding protein precursor [Shewanella khirikhana]
MLKILSKLALLFAFIPLYSQADAERIIALSPHAVEMLYAIGAGDRIVATTDHADYPEQAKLIPRIGGYYGIQMERVLELKPDLIVTWDGGNRAEDIEMLKKFGFKLFASNPKTLDAVAQELLTLGELTGTQGKARTVAADYRADLAALRLANRSKPKVRLFYQLWSQPLMTVGKGSWIEQIIDVCNGENLFLDASGDYPQVSVESVLLKKPEVILRSQDEGNVNGIDWSRWPEIPAVAKGQIYELNADLLHRAGPRAIDGVEALCGALDKAR